MRYNAFINVPLDTEAARSAAGVGRRAARRCGAMAQKKYSPFAKKLQVHPVDDDGAAPEAATKTLEPATIREDYAQDVQYYKDLLAHQETGLLCCRSSLIINPKGRYMHCWDMVALVALLLTAVATPFEVAFVRFAPETIGEATSQGTKARWFFFNRAVDAAFSVDMVQTFLGRRRRRRRGLLEERARGDPVRGARALEPRARGRRLRLRRLRFEQPHGRPSGTFTDRSSPLTSSKSLPSASCAVQATMVACNSLALLLSLRVSVAFMASPPKSLITKIAPLKAEATDETLYALGVNVATQLGDIRKLFPTEEMPQILRGIEDYLTNKVADPTDILRANANDINAMLQDRMVKVVADEQVKGLAAQEEAAAREGATRTASGLVIEHVKEGAGPQPTAASTVSVHYVGTLVDGTVFDSSRARGEPAQFAVKQVIAGWQEALLLMAEGGTAKLTIPADIAYGDAGSGDKIPGGATICFEVELIKVLSGGVGGLVL